MNKEISEIAKLTERISKDPKSKLFVPLAEEYKKTGDIDMSIQVLQEGIRNNPAYVTARSFLGRLLIEKGDIPGARKEFEEVVKAIPDNLLAHRKLGDIYAVQGKRGDALTHYKTVLMLNPKDAETAMLVAELEAGRDIRQHLPGQKPAEGQQKKQAPAAAIDREEAEEVLVVEPLDGPGPEAQAGSLEQELAASNLSFLSETVQEPASEPGKGEEFDPVAVGDPFGSGVPGRGPAEEAPFAAGADPEKQSDDFTTDTLAELYISQGFYEKAVDIYERMLVDKPNSRGLKDKLAKVRAMASSASPEETKPDSTSFSIRAEPAPDFGGSGFDAFAHPSEPGPVPIDRSDASLAGSFPVPDADVPPPAPDSPRRFDVDFEPREYVPPDAALHPGEGAAGESGIAAADPGGHASPAGRDKAAAPGNRSARSKQETIERLEGWLKNIMKES